MSGSPRAVKAFIAFFFVIWCALTFGAAYNSYEWGVPFIFVLTPFLFGVFGLFFCLCLMRADFTSPLPRTYTAAPFSGPTGDSSYSSDHLEQRTIYQVPNRCISCGASLSTEDVDWVGPLQIRCPYCSATMDVEEKRF
jgi:hypothetical protein